MRLDDSKATLKRANLEEKGQPDLGCPFRLSLFFHFDCLESARLEMAESFSLDFIGETNEEDAIREWASLYLQGISSPFPLPLELPFPPFTQRVLTELQEVPFGQTISYKALAMKAKSPNAARAVGNACNKNPFPLIIPCHRVIEASGDLGGFEYGCEMKQKLLNFEQNVLKVKS